MPEITIVADAKTILGESPLWDEERSRLYWVGVLDGLIFSSPADAREVAVWRFPGPINAMALRRSGGMVITSGTAVYLFDPATGDADLVCDVDPRPDMNGNDGTVDRRGRYVFGISDRQFTTAAGEEPGSEVVARGGYYRMDPDFSIHLLLDGYATTNGPCFTARGDVFYCADSASRQIHAHDYDPVTGEVSRPRLLAAFEDPVTGRLPARPDGATVDDEGFVWVAAVYAGEVRRYAPDGSLDRVIVMPVEKPTSVAFGGDDLDVLFVTSMANRGVEIDGPSSAGPLAGSLLAVRGLGVRGVPEPRFAG